MVKVMVGSPVLVKFHGGVHRGVIRDIRPKSKRMKVSIVDKSGHEIVLWKDSKELKTELVEDVTPAEIKVLDK